MAHDTVYPAPDLSIPQLTIRAVLTGMVLGGLLSACNIYSGLKIGWGFNMSITAALLSYGFWEPFRMAGMRPWNKLENNVNQTAASAAANISSAGLVAPIPALTMITGYEWGYWTLVVWTFSVALVGVVVAIGLRRQMLIHDQLPFPNGIATAETMNEMYARGKEALARVYALLAGAVVAGTIKALIEFKFKAWFSVKKFAVPFWKIKAGKGWVTLKNLTFALDPSPLFVGVGAIIGLRAGYSMLVGAIFCWGVLSPLVLDSGWAPAGPPNDDAMWFGPLVKWTLWPGVILMVTASLTSFAFSYKQVWAAITGTRMAGPDAGQTALTHDVPRKLFIYATLAALLLSVILQFFLFDVHWAVGTFGVLLTFLLAIVAARVSGETGITPVGPMGKVTQLTFGVVAPANVTANLMAANVTGGAASQAADLLHDMKTGLMIGASPRYQAVAQSFGVLAGALAGCWVYMLLIPDPTNMLLTDEWPAPAALQWKAVAEILTQGLDQLPSGAMIAMALAAFYGIALAVVEKTAPKEAITWLPSPTAMGIAFCIPASYSISMFLGGLINVLGFKYFKEWSTRFMIVVAAGIIAGDSLTGVVIAIRRVIMGLAGG